MINKKPFEHGDSSTVGSKQARKNKEVTEHLKRFWNLIPRADVDSIIKPLTMLQESVVYQECFSSINEEAAGDDDFSYEFDELDTYLLQ